MDCPRDLIEMKDIVGPDETTFCVCETCGGAWVDSAELNRLLLHNDLPGLESMGGKTNLDELAERCPKDEVDLIVIEGGDKASPESYDYCEACGGIWLEVGAPAGADADQVEALIIEFFQRFRRVSGSTRTART